MRTVRDAQSKRGAKRRKREKPRAVLRSIPRRPGDIMLRLAGVDVRGVVLPAVGGGVRGGAHVLGVVADGVGDQLAAVSVVAAAQRVAGLVPGVVRGGVQRAVPGVRPSMARGDDVQGDRLEDREIRLPVETVQAVALNPGRLIFSTSIAKQTNTRVH